MFRPEPGHAWLAIFNPTSTTSQAFIEDNSTDREGRDTWHKFTLDCLAHPNIVEYQPGVKPRIPAAVTFAQVDDWVNRWCQAIPANEASAADIEWPKGSGQWWKQGPSFLARCRGLWPTGGVWTVWSELNWQLAVKRQQEPPPVGMLPEIGCDAAQGGEDFCSIHVRWGHESHYHES